MVEKLKKSKILSKQGKEKISIYQSKQLTQEKEDFNAIKTNSNKLEFKLLRIGLLRLNVIAVVL